MPQQSTFNKNVYIDACYQAGPLLLFPNIYGILAETPAFEVVPKEQIRERHCPNC